MISSCVPLILPFLYFFFLYKAPIDFALYSHSDSYSMNAAFKKMASMIIQDLLCRRHDILELVTLKDSNRKLK